MVYVCGVASSFAVVLIFMAQCDVKAVNLQSYMARMTAISSGVWNVLSWTFPVKPFPRTNQKFVVSCLSARIGVDLLVLLIVTQN